MLVRKPTANLAMPTFNSAPVPTNITMQDATRSHRRLSHMLEALFARYDIDNSGGIDRHELLVALNSLGLSTDSSQASKVLEKYDVDGSGVLEVSEFCHLIDELRAYHTKLMAENDDVACIFYAYDVDRSNSIEHHELPAALAALGLPADLFEAGLILARYDADKNGCLDLQEFRALVHDLRAYHEHCKRPTTSLHM